MCIILTGQKDNNGCINKEDTSFLIWGGVTVRIYTVVYYRNMET